MEKDFKKGLLFVELPKDKEEERQEKEEKQEKQQQLF